MGEVSAGLRKLKLQLRDQLLAAQEEHNAADAALHKAVKEAGDKMFKTNDIVERFRAIFNELKYKDKLVNDGAAFKRNNDENKDELVLSISQPKTGERYGSILDIDIHVDAPAEILAAEAELAKTSKKVSDLNGKINKAEMESHRMQEYAMQARAAIANKYLRRNEETSKELDDIISKTVAGNATMVEALECLRS